MSKLKEAWREMISLFGAAGPATRASALHGRALKLDEDGKTQEAFELTRQALDSLSSPGIDQTSPPVLSSVLVMTVFLAQLSTKLGNPGAADGAIKEALDLAAARDNDPKVREYTEWLRHRLQTG